MFIELMKKLMFTAVVTLWVWTKIGEPLYLAAAVMGLFVCIFYAVYGLGEWMKDRKRKKR